MERERWRNQRPRVKLSDMHVFIFQPWEKDKKRRHSLVPFHFFSSSWGEKEKRGHQENSYPAIIVLGQKCLLHLASANPDWKAKEYKNLSPLREREEEEKGFGWHQALGFISFPTLRLLRFSSSLIFCLGTRRWKSKSTAGCFQEEKGNDSE